MSYVSEDLLQDHFQLDSGLFRTFRDLSLSPGASIRDYLDGKRKRYFNPLSYLLLASAIYVLIAHFLGFSTFSGDVVSGFAEGMGNDGNALSDSFLKALESLAGNQTLLLLVTLPLFSFGSYVAFRRSGYSYLEHVVINMLITSQQMLIYLSLNVALAGVTLVEAIAIPFGMAYNTWVFCTLCKSYGLVNRLVRSVLIYILYWAQIIVLLFLMVILVTALG